MVDMWGMVIHILCIVVVIMCGGYVGYGHTYIVYSSS